MKPSFLRSLSAVVLTTAVLSGCSGLAADRTAIAGTENWSAMSFSADQRREVVLFFGDRDKLTELANAGADIYSVDVKGKRAQVAINAAQAELAKKLGMGVGPFPQGMKQGVDKGYRTYEQIVARMKELAAKHPEFATVVDIGDSWEKTQGKANRDILALKLTKGGNKPIVTFAGCHHARELVTPEMVLKQAEYLVDSYGVDAEATAAVDNREIWLVPMVNPDGHNIVMTTGRDQRKNGNNVTGGKSRVGVDLNRNYDAVWGTVGDSGNPESDTFRGSKAFSEPETQAIRDLIRAHKPSIYLTFHSYSNSIMWPFDSTKEVPKDKRLMPLGRAMGKLSGYEAYQGCDMYLNSGDDIEWAYRELGVLGYTVEVGTWNDGFMPPFSKVPQFFKENQAMMNYALKVADNPGAVSGPAIRTGAVRGNVTIDAPGAQRVEYFLGRPGAAGTGMTVKLNNGEGQLPAFNDGRQLVYVRAQDSNGTWGPTEAVWSR